MNPLADNLFGEAVINYRIVIVITARCECTCAANEDGGKHPTHNLSHNCLEIKIVYKCLFYLGHLEGGGVGAAVGLLA
jgi:hypothetical protein